MSNNTSSPTDFLAELTAPETRELLDSLLRPRDDTRPPPVTQQMLRLYEMLEQLTDAKYALRRLFIQSNEAGMRCEAGPLKLTVRPRQVRDFSYIQLERILGRPHADRLRSQLIPTLRYYVRVRPTQTQWPTRLCRRSPVRDGFDAGEAGRSRALSFDDGP